MAHMSDEDEKQVRLCPTCGCRVPPSENMCPQCGNVFRKEDSDWEWRLISKHSKNGKEETDEEEDE